MLPNCLVFQMLISNSYLTSTAYFSNIEINWRTGLRLMGGNKVLKGLFLICLLLTSKYTP